MWSFNDYAKTLNAGHYSNNMTDEQLRAAWLLLFGSEPISFVAIGAKGDSDDFRIAYEAYKRGMLDEENNVNTYTRYYTLKK